MLQFVLKQTPIMSSWDTFNKLH